MENKKRALGRGLEDLFNSENIDYSTVEQKIYESASNEEIVELNLSDLRPNPYQPRKVFDEEALNELASSIKEHGVFQPIIVKKSIKGYDIIAGERRFRASKMAGLEKIPAIVREFTDEQMMEIALLENLQRENLSAIEEATAYKAMIDAFEDAENMIDDVDAGAVFEVEPDEGFDIGFGASATGASVGSAVGFLSDSVCGN